MPGQDGTGPQGHGPKSGRGLGPCGRGQGKGFGRKRGFGFRHSESNELTKDEQKKMLETELRELEEEKLEIDKRLRAL